ncbi:small integral membrane protein 24 isoform 2-T2 [Guaruba guarouba]
MAAPVPVPPPQAPRCCGVGGTCPLACNKSCPLAPGAQSRACTCPSPAVGQDPHRGAGSRVLQPFADLPPKMLRAWQHLSLLVLLVLAATARGQDGTGPKELQPWLVGLTAVVVFLFIVFILLLANRLWKLRMRRLERSGCVHRAAEKGSGDESDGEGQRRATQL